MITGGTWETSVPSSQFCCKHKTALKKKNLIGLTDTCDGNTKLLLFEKVVVTSLT